jgi:hypothetical protein
MMTITEQTELIARILDRLAKITTEVVGKIPPRYLMYESLHPRKKPRGSIRRRRRQNENITSQSI